MARMIRQFGERLKTRSGVGLFYYAGHGVQVEGRNYLIPVDASIRSENEVELEAVDVSRVLVEMENADNALNIVVLDACRNNPFSRSWRSTNDGLAQINAPTGTLIAYSTAPGKVASDGAGRNAPYTAALLKALQIPDLSLSDVFMQVRADVQKVTARKQTPWEASSVIGRFYFKQSRNADTTKRVEMQTISDAQIEQEYWDNIKTSQNVQEFKDYLKEYPNGRFAPLARLKVNQYEKSNDNQNNASNLNELPRRNYSQEEKERYNRFDAAIKGIKGKNVADTFFVGKEVLANESADSPIALDAAIVLASLGYDQAITKVDTYNNDAVNYAKSVIQKLEAGKTSKNFGAYQYEFKTKDNTLGWMNYTIGYINYYRQDKKNEALPYLYKATQLNSETKKFSDIYRIFGAWYLDEALRIDKERLEKTTAAGNKDTDETLAMYALQRGYAERSIDAYARAYNLATAPGSRATKEYKDALYTQLQGLYKFRYDGKIEGIDVFVATIMNKQMPDPKIPVSPVFE